VSRRGKQKGLVTEFEDGEWESAVEREHWILQEMKYMQCNNGDRWIDEN
jgi:hypothetical protein